jgi:hypothetical protein
VMGDFVRRLVDDDRNDLFELAVALVLNLLFLGLAALLLWPLGRTALALSLAKGLGLLWIVLGLTTPLVHGAQRLARMNLYDRANLFFASNLVASCALQIGWAAVAAPAVQTALPGASPWVAAALHATGALSCLAAYAAVSAVYQGTLYRLVSLPLALVCYVAFSVWPVGGWRAWG